MFRPCLVALALLATGAVGCGSSDGGEEERPDNGHEEDPQVDAIAEGRALYVRYCALCHGERGEGYVADHAPALANQSFLSVATDEFLRDAIAEGRPGTPMSAWSRLRGGPLSGGDVHKIVRFIRSWQTVASVDVHGTRVTGGDVNRAQAIYALHCKECHGDDGSGSDTAVSLTNPQFLATVSDGFIRHTILHGRPGTPMPAFQGRIAEMHVADLVALIRSWPGRQPLRPPDQAHPPEEIEIDWNHVVLNPDGGAPSFQLRDERFVPARAVKRALDQHRRIIILDARATSDWQAGHIPGAVPVPFYDMEPMLERLPKDGTWIIAYCGCPHAASGRVVDQLRQNGFPRAAILDEGIHFWIDEGFPVRTGMEP